MNKSVPHSNTLTVSRISLQVEFLTKGRISSNIANTLRGGFGAALKNSVCTFSNKKCKECMLSNKCAYGYIFETPIPSNTTIMRKYPFAPHPLIIIPPKSNPGYISKQNTSNIDVVLIGKAIDYFPYILLAFKELGTRGLGINKVEYCIERASTEDGEIIYNSEEGLLEEIVSKKTFQIAAGKPKHGIFSIHFITPLRLKVKGKITGKPSFKDIISALTRRVFLLSYFHCGGNDEPVHKQFLEHVGNVEMIDANIIKLNQNRFSARQRQKIPMNGFMGTLTFKGDYGTFMPLLKAGEYIHIGKDTVFGYGQYTMEVHSKNDK